MKLDDSKPPLLKGAAQSVGDFSWEEVIMELIDVDCERNGIPLTPFNKGGM